LNYTDEEVEVAMKEFQNGPNNCSLSDVADHIDHVAKLIGAFRVIISD
jgi:microsomal dipeptidase-like Zn-dependent dipeptidase